MEDLLKDSNKNGIMSQIVKRISDLEEYVRTHKGIQHQRVTLPTTYTNVFNAMFAPVSAGALDDEFADASGGVPGGWTKFDPAATLTIAENTYGLLMSAANHVGSQVTGMYKTLPAGDFSIATRVGQPEMSVGSDATCGIVLWEDATNNAKKLLTCQMYSSGSLTVAAYEWTNYTTVGPNKVTARAILAEEETAVYLRLRRNGTNYYFDISVDPFGKIWKSANTTNAAFTLSFTPTHVGLYFNNSASGVTRYGIFDFFRYIASDVTNLAVLNGRRL